MTEFLRYCVLRPETKILGVIFEYYQIESLTFINYWKGPSIKDVVKLSWFLTPTHSVGIFLYYYLHNVLE